MAKRVDPADGKSYTRQEFLDQYGGLAEWGKARPAGREAGGAANRSPVVRNTGPLVTEVKEKQRTNAGFRDAWVQWCDAHAEGTKDPGLLQDSLLRKAIRECASAPAGASRAGKGGGGGGAAGRGAGRVEKRIDPADGNAYTRQEFQQCYGGVDEWSRASAGGAGGRGRGGGTSARGSGGGQPGFSPYPSQKKNNQPSTSLQKALAGRVRDLKKRDPQFREAWLQYVETHTSFGNAMGTKDPMLHSPQFLRAALAELEGFNPVAVAVLAQAVMERQRVDTDGFRTRWITYCQEHCNGTCDPRRLDENSLRNGLKECGMRDLAALTKGIALVQQVKTLQKDQDWCDRWKEWCKVNNNGTIDPVLTSVSALEQALTALK